jgi:hypothetical protein
MDYSLNVLQHILIGNAKHLNMHVVFQPSRTHQIMLIVSGVNVAVHFYCEPGFRAIKVKNESTRGSLPAEVMAKIVPSKAGPRQTLGRSGFSA